MTEITKLNEWMRYGRNDRNHQTDGTLSPWPKSPKIDEMRSSWLKSPKTKGKTGRGFNDWNYQTEGRKGTLSQWPKLPKNIWGAVVVTEITKLKEWMGHDRNDRNHQIDGTRSPWPKSPKINEMRLQWKKNHLKHKEKMRCGLNDQNYQTEGMNGMGCNDRNH